jgi:hypothetical protein
MNENEYITPTCSCVVEISPSGEIKMKKMCEYHFSVSKNGLGRVFVGS